MKKLPLIFIILVLNINCIFSQETIYMPYVETINIHKDYQYTVAKLFKTYVNNLDKYKIVLPQKLDSAYYKESFKESKQNAQKYNAPYFIIAELNRIGEIVIISFNMYNSQDGTEIWSGIMKADSPDDIDPVIQKFAQNIGSEKILRDESDIYNVSNYDSQELKKIHANYSLGLSIGGSFPFVDVENKSGAGFGLLASYDNRDVIFDISGNLYFSAIDIYYLKISAKYPFWDKANTPYIDGGLGFAGISNMKKYEYSDYGFINQEKYTKTGGGLMLFAGGGYILKRNSNVQLQLNGNIFYSAFNVDNVFQQTSNANHPEISDLNNPFGLMFNIIILFSL